jgi:hypothetical protein
MISVVDFASEINSVTKGNYTFFPRFTLMRMASLGRVKERVDKRVEKEMEKIDEDEKKGSLKKLSNDFKQFSKDIYREERIENKEVKGEEKIELNLLMKLGKCIMVLRDERELRRKISGIIKRIQSLSEEQLKDLEQVKAGGRPWLGVAGIMKYDIGECGNITITTARSMRGEWSKIMPHIDNIVRLGGQLKSAKDKDKAKKYVDGEIAQLDESVSNLMKIMKFHYLVSLRLFRFLVDELNTEMKHIEKMDTEGLPLAKSKDLKKTLNKALVNFTRKVEGESEAAQRLIQTEERFEKMAA